MNLDKLALQLKPIVLRELSEAENICLILSASDMRRQAIVQHVYAKNIRQAFDNGFRFLQYKLEFLGIQPIILKIDWIIETLPIKYSDYCLQIKSSHKNYLNYGIIFDNDYQLVITSLELISNGIYLEDKLDFSNEYFYHRFNSTPLIYSDTEIVLFKTKSIFTYKDQIYSITSDLNFRDINNKSNINLIQKIINNATNYLLINCLDSGQFKYLYLPIKNRYSTKYNILRHLGTIYSLLKVYEYTNNKYILPIIKRSILYVTSKYLSFHYIKNNEYIFISENNTIKLGGNALALLVFNEYSKLINNQKYKKTISGLVNGILYMQNEDGSFNHIISNFDLKVVRKFQIEYYQDEAIFALIEYYKNNKNDYILKRAVISIKNFIQNNNDKFMDHWLSYAINSLTDIAPLKDLFIFGIKNFNTKLDFIYNSFSIYNVLLELLCQSKLLLNKSFKNFPELDIYNTFDINYFNNILKYRAEKQLEGFGWPEIAMYFKSPYSILNSFFIRHKDFRIRIDDIQHCILGLLSYLKILKNAT